MDLLLTYSPSHRPPKARKAVSATTGEEDFTPISGGVVPSWTKDPAILTYARVKVELRPVLVKENLLIHRLLDTRDQEQTHWAIRPVLYYAARHSIRWHGCEEGQVKNQEREDNGMYEQSLPRRRALHLPQWLSTIILVARATTAWLLESHVQHVHRCEKGKFSDCFSLA